MKEYNFNNLQGCIQQRKNHQTSTTIGVYHSEQAGFEKDEPSCKYSTVCEEHGTMIGHSSLKFALAWAADPKTWCEVCQKS